MKLSSVIAGIALFVTLGAVGGGLALYKAKQIAIASAPPPAYEPTESIRIVDAKSIDWRPMSDLVGTAFSIRSVRVSNEVAGVAREVRFQSGSIVEAGETLLVLDDTIERADLAAAEAAVRVAEANVAVNETRASLAASEWKRIEDATRERATTPMEIDRGRAEVDRTVADRIRLLAEVDQAKARVAQVQAQLDKHVIKAAFRARAGIRTVHEGQYLAEGAPIVMLEEIADSIYLDFAIPQEYLVRVRPGLTIMATSPVLGPDPVPITVVAIDATVSNDTRNARVRALVPNKSDGTPGGQGRIRPGMFVQIRVPVDETKQFVAVPATAVRRASYGDHLFVVVPGEGPGEFRAKQRPIKLGPSVGEDVIILEGVAPGERVAATGSFKLRDGGRVADLAAAKPDGAPGAQPAPAKH